MYIYADIYVDHLVSFGVDLGYDNTKLGSPDAQKNEAVWYMGDGTVAGNHTYMAPDISTSGHVVFIGGKLDESAPAAGVTGLRVLLGIVTFTRLETGNPGSTPETYFDISLALGRPSPYDNFVTVSEDGTESTLRDGSVAFGSITVARRGDANNDGMITNVDLGTVRNLILAGQFVVYADANGDGFVTNVDLGTIRNMILSGG